MENDVVNLALLNKYIDINMKGKNNTLINTYEYIHKNEYSALSDMRRILTCEDSLLNFYRRVILESEKPDLVGKTVECNEKQFIRIYNMVKRISLILNITAPKVYIYEDVFYRAEVEGLDTPWIILSSKLVYDFDDSELMFVLGKELSKIQCNQNIYEASVRALNDVSNYVNIIPGVSVINNFHLIDGYRIKVMPKVNSWRRTCCYSTDNCGLLICGSFKAAYKAILKQILNSSDLVDEVNLIDYLNKVSEIKGMSGKMIDYSKLDEAVPYGPNRILNLLQFSGTKRFNEGITKLSREDLWDL